MSLIFNGTNIPSTGAIKFDGTSLEKIIFDGVEVWNVKPPVIFFVNGATSKAVTAYAAGFAGQTKAKPTVNPQSDRINYWINPKQEGSLWFNDGIDLTNYTKLTVTYTYNNDGAEQMALYLKKTKSVDDSTYLIRCNGASEVKKTVTFDLSTYTGVHYFGMWLYHGVSADLYTVKFE